MQTPGATIRRMMPPVDARKGDVAVFLRMSAEAILPHYAASVSA